ncbi:PstS family phosphate ABC transporter substrate-binding protein [Calothrix sp. UHCC 0171]|uniref:PstS family phosphate ABC transporter substrate-binding protein n=1 Tax=Calothrix sp. UHCC 0171 TaxID=3110245 RepID=UPI002B1F6895|nr:PstS family phosphate ABC transporter substrate-binding protein [Calothrix sp. UHCC 0171]MEA5572209.1 PstS family phosphate ABC transporter substrate-binding protein [Calothrix sp. UHCC 0171]
MAQKNEAAVLFLALLITLGLVGGVYFWLAGNSNVKFVSTTTNSSQQSSQPSEETLAQVQNVPSGLFRYGGSTTWAPIRKEVDSAIKTVLPKFQLSYTDPISRAPGSGTGIKMLLDNQLAFAQSSRALEPEEYQIAQQKGFTLKEIPVAIDGIAIAVHPDLNISSLTIQQIKKIYTGKITNWQEVGGSNLAIKAYSRRLEDGGTVEFFYQNVLDKEKFGSQVQFTPTTTTALRQVATNVGSIYYASAPEIVPQCTVKTIAIGRKPGEAVVPYQEPLVPRNQCPQKVNQLNQAAFQSGQYPITRRLFVIVKENSQIDQQAGEAYARLLLTDQGQELISKSGFVRIR